MKLSVDLAVLRCTLLLHGLFVLLLIVASSAIAAAQVAPPSPAPAATPNSAVPAVGEITGTILADDGQPLPEAQVLLYSARSETPLGPSKNINAFANGRFRLTGLRPGVYYLGAYSPGYVMPERDDPTGRPLPYRVGAIASLTLTKGGVLTGTVTDVTGEPLVGVHVTAVRVRDGFGRKPRPALSADEGFTDDRGIYRIYGLQAGSYVVAAGTVAAAGIVEINNDSLNAAPVYYPSSSADAAVKVEVGLGQEVGGIDIRVRGDAGHDLSGTVVGAPKGPDGKTMPVVCLLQRANSGTPIGATFLQEQNGQIQFSFSHVPDGEYELLAETWQREGGAGSIPQPVTIKGADLSGIRVPMTGFGAISGRLVLAADATLRERPECAATARPATVEEFAFDLRSVKYREPFGRDAWSDRGGTVPDEQGNFQRSGIRAGTYFPQLDLPDDRWYLRSVTRPGLAGKPVNALVNGQVAGLVLGGGEKLTGLTLTMTDGAASLKGRLALPNGTAVGPGASSAVPSATLPILPLPAHVLVHLIPAEPTSADDVLRYREIEAGADGSFALANLAPGKYWVYAEQFPATTPPAGEASTTARTPAAWDATARLKLRRAAEAANVAMELKPCQRVTDYVFRFTLATAR